MTTLCDLHCKHILLQCAQSLPSRVFLSHVTYAIAIFTTEMTTFVNYSRAPPNTYYRSGSYVPPQPTRPTADVRDDYERE